MDTFLAKKLFNCSFQCNIFKVGPLYNLYDQAFYQKNPLNTPIKIKQNGVALQFHNIYSIYLIEFLNKHCSIFETGLN